MATTIVPGAAQAPRLALGVVLERKRPGRASIADVAAAPNVLTAVITDEDAPPLDIADAHARGISALAVVEHAGARLIITGSGGLHADLGSWRLDGSCGPLQHPDAHMGGITALAVVEHDGAPLVMTGGRYPALRSWHLDVSRGPLQALHADNLGITALAVVEHDGPPLIVSGGAHGDLRSWRLDGTPVRLIRENAHAG